MADTYDNMPYYPGGGDNGATPPPAGGNGSNPWAFLQNILGLGNSGGTSSLTLPAIAAAFNQYRNAGRYRDYGRAAADRASPISTAERQRSLGLYRQWEEDPNKFLETNPVYQGALRQGINAASRAGASQGLMGSGEMLLSLQRVGQDTAGKFIPQELNRLRQDAGFQFDPGNAAQLELQGAHLGMQSENEALGNIFFALQNMAGGGQPAGAPGATPGRPGNTPGRPGASPGSAGGNSFAGITPQVIQGLATQLGIAPGDLFQSLGRMQDQFGIAPADAVSLWQSGLAQSLGWDLRDPGTWTLGDADLGSPGLDQIIGNIVGPNGGGGDFVAPDFRLPNPWESLLPTPGSGGGGGFPMPGQSLDDVADFDWGSWWNSILG